MNESDVLALIDEVKDSIDNLWILTSAAIVFFMQAGFCLLETGSVRPKNINNSLIKNLIDCAIGAIVYYLIGYGLAYGDVDGEFAGHKFFGGEDLDKDNGYNSWMFQFAFASTSATIVSGAVAERINLVAYMIYSAVFNSFVYPIISAWVWGGGWLYKMDPPFIDFAGSGVVHITGGVSSLVGILLLGARLGRFRKELVEFQDPLSGRRVRVAFSPEEFRPSSQVYAVSGVFILWLGWLFFNAGSTLRFTDKFTYMTGKVMMNSTLGGAAGGLIVFYFKIPIYNRITKKVHKSHFKPKYDIVGLNNGCLVGLVAVTAGCSNIQPWAALIIGSIGGFAYIFGYILGEKLELDDPCDTIYIHLCGGIVGIILPSFLDETTGVCYGGDGKQIGIQLLGMIAIMAWSGIGTFLIFGTCHYFKFLRMPYYAEVYGLDRVDNGVYAMNTDLKDPEMVDIDTKDGDNDREADDSKISDNFKLKKTKTIADHLKEFDKFE
jgi:Amt family ammonium transporter